jgi:hypothetical protein
MYIELEKRILLILQELEDQKRIEEDDSKECLSHKDSIYQIKEFVEAGEYGIAYMSLVFYFEDYNFNISSFASVKLLELGLLMGFKTDREEDQIYNVNKFSS